MNRQHIHILILVATIILIATTEAFSRGLPKYIYVTHPTIHLLTMDYEDAPIQAEFPFGTRFKVLGKSEEWFKVSIDNLVGYVSEYSAHSFGQMSIATRNNIKNALKKDHPMVELTPGDTVLRRDSIHVYALVGDGLGEVVKKEWSIGSTPFIPTLKADTVIYAPGKADSNYLVIFRVTDNSGLIALDTAKYHVLGRISDKTNRIPSKK